MQPGPARAGYNEGNWSPDLVGPFLSALVVGAPMIVVGYLLGRFGFDRTARAVNGLAILALVVLFVMSLIYMGEMVSLLTMYGSLCAGSALVFFYLGRRTGVARAAAGVS